MLTATQSNAPSMADCAIDAIVDNTPAQLGDRQDACARRPVHFSRHAHGRAARRNLAPDAVQYALTHGRRVQRTGVTFYFLGRRDMPEADRRASWAAQLEGIVVLVAPDGEVVTVYRNCRALRTILKKMKYRLPNIDQDRARDMSELTWWTSVAGGQRGSLSNNMMTPVNGSVEAGSAYIAVTPSLL